MDKLHFSSDISYHFDKSLIILIMNSRIDKKKMKHTAARLAPNKCSYLPFMIQHFNSTVDVFISRSVYPAQQWKLYHYKYHSVKWLNNISFHNDLIVIFCFNIFRWFMAVLVTGMIGVFLVFLVDLVAFITYFTDKNDGKVLLPYIGKE